MPLAYPALLATQPTGPRTGFGAEFCTRRAPTLGGLLFSRSPSAAVNAPPVQEDDVALIAAMARGDERAAARVYDRHSAVVYGLALRIVHEVADAEEVVIEVFAQAWREAARFDSSRGSALGWLTTITRTRALDVVRSRQRRDRATNAASTMLDAPAAMSEGFRSPDTFVEDADRATAVAEALRELPEAQRSAIELAFYEGLTHPEVAERLKEPLGTVKTRIRLGMLKLRDILATLGSERVT
jgi:RNA polymerase sigma-70 factor (ECF subfamily)